MFGGDLLGSAVPVFRIAGTRQGGLARDLIRMEVDEDTSGMKRLAARFTAWGPAVRDGDEGELWFDRKVVDFGARLVVSIGQPGADRTIFDGTLSAIEADHREGREPEMVAFAEDDLMKLRLKHRFKTWENVTDEDIVRTICGDHSLKPDCDAAGPTHALVQQWNVSDLAFLRERARRLQAEIWVADGKLGFKTRDRRQGAEITLVVGGTLLRLDARADLAHQRTEAVVSGYSIAGRAAIDESAKRAAVTAEAPAGTTGLDLLDRTLGAATTFRVREAPVASDGARAWAKAELLRRARAFVTVKGLTAGTADLVVGGRVVLKRVAAPFLGGGYYVTRVTHTYDQAEGFRTAFEAERATVAA